MSNSNDTKVEGPCPACSHHHLRRRQSGSIYCGSCKCSGFTADELREAAEGTEPAPRAQGQRHIGKPAGRIVIGRGARWGAGLA